jgi:hypothetical protein
MTVHGMTLIDELTSLELNMTVMSLNSYRVYPCVGDYILCQDRLMARRIVSEGRIRQCGIVLPSFTLADPTPVSEKSTAENMAPITLHFNGCGYHHKGTWYRKSVKCYGINGDVIDPLTQISYR